MAYISQDDRTVIAEHPLDDSLDHLQDALQKAEQSYDAEDHNFSQELGKATSRLLVALLTSNAALYLNSKIGNRDLASHLLMLRKNVLGGDFNYEHYRSLARLVIRGASDVDIWSAVVNLIITVSGLTPPTNIPVSYDGTPITHSSSSQQGSEQTTQLVEARIFEEIKDCTYREVGGFFSKYFEGKEWSERSKEVYNAVKARHVDGRWTDFPKLPAEKAVFEWLSRFQEEFLSDARGTYYTSTSSSDLTGAEPLRQLDFFIKPSCGDSSRAKHDWKDVQVIGELRVSNNDWKRKLLQLGRYMRDVFSIQPTRRFVHGFTLLGTTMELWVFDRSGPYSSGPFDIHEEPEQFIRAIAGYAMMSDEELGLDTFVERIGGDRFITIMEDATAKETKLQLEQNPFVIQRVIVCRGTNCHRSKDLEKVVKFSWTSDKRPPESKLLRLACERGVDGVARLLCHHRITSINEMREGLTFSTPHHFRNTNSNASASPALSQSLGHMSIAKKRKSADDQAESSKGQGPTVPDRSFVSKCHKSLKLLRQRSQSLWTTMQRLLGDLHPTVQDSA